MRPRQTVKPICRVLKYLYMAKISTSVHQLILDWRKRSVAIYAALDVHVLVSPRDLTPNIMGTHEKFIRTAVFGKFNSRAGLQPSRHNKLTSSNGT